MFLGVEELMDDATYYQLVHSNIEPDIHFQYFHVEVEDKKIGVFRIFNCDNQPYLMKKDTKNPLPQGRIHPQGHVADAPCAQRP